jgi:hypothetical protein
MDGINVAFQGPGKLESFAAKFTLVDTREECLLVRFSFIVDKFNMLQ